MKKKGYEEKRVSPIFHDFKLLSQLNMLRIALGECLMADF
jgi:hypothetical protein